MEGLGYDDTNCMIDNNMFITEDETQESYMLLGALEPSALNNLELRTSPATGELPSKENFPGIYNFQMTVGQPGVDSKRQTWQYSLRLRKAFIKVGCTLPVQFKISQNQPLPQGLYIRAVAVFSDPPDAATSPVLRCPVHKQSTTDSVNIGYQFLDHVVSCNHNTATYEVDPVSNRHSVRVDLRGPQPGAEGEIFLFAMMCRSSCNGFNRRPLVLIFTLERDFEVLGRQVLPVRVCAAPKRDCTTEENRMEADNSAELEENPRAQNEDYGDEAVQPDGYYLVPVHTTEDFVTLTKYAKELVEKDYAEGTDKQNELSRYEALLSQYNGQD